MDANPQRRTMLPWIAGISALLAAILLVLAFVPLKTCPNRMALEERTQEPGTTGAHLPTCTTCSGRGRIPCLKWVMLCKVCGGSGVEKGIRQWIYTPDTKCFWCEGTGKRQFKLR